MCIGVCLHIDLVPYMCVLSLKARRGQQVSWHWSYRLLAAIWVLRSKLGLLEEQRVFLSISAAPLPLDIFESLKTEWAGDRDKTLGQLLFMSESLVRQIIKDFYFWLLR